MSVGDKDGSFLGGGGVSSWAASAQRGEGGGLAFEIQGHELQLLEAELRPGEAIIAEAGQMMFKDAAGFHGDHLRRRQRAAGNRLLSASCSAAQSAFSPARLCS